MLSVEAWRRALQVWDDMHRLKPNEADKREMMAAIGTSPVFLGLEKREKYFTGMLLIRRRRELHADVNRLHQTTERKADARRFKSLEGVIELLGRNYDSVHFARTVARMRDRRGLTNEEAVTRMLVFEEIARDLLLSSEEIAKETVAKGNVLPIDDEETLLTINLLESVGLKVGKSRNSRMTTFIAQTWTYTNPGSKELSGEGVKRRIGACEIYRKDRRVFSFQKDNTNTL